MTWILSRLLWSYPTLACRSTIIYFRKLIFNSTIKPKTQLYFPCNFLTFNIKPIKIVLDYNKQQLNTTVYIIIKKTKLKWQKTTPERFILHDRTPWQPVSWLFWRPRESQVALAFPSYSRNPVLIFKFLWAYDASSLFSSHQRASLYKDIPLSSIF